MKYPRFVIYTDPHHHFYYRLYSDRGKILLTGETYDLRAQCVHAIHELMTIVEADQHYRVFHSSGGHYFTVIAHAHRVIGTSEVFRTMPGMAHGIHSVKKFVGISVIEDCDVKVRFFTNK